MKLGKFTLVLFGFLSIFWTGALSSPTGPVNATTTVSTNLQTVQLVAAPSVPNQQLQPGAIKHPGEKCATVFQPPEYQGCPGPQNNIVNGKIYCQGNMIQIGQCLAAEQGFFGYMQPRNSREACIMTRENGNNGVVASYGRSTNPSHFGRYQFDYQTWKTNGGLPDSWGYASPGEQDRIFVQAVANDGYSPWAGYDGC